MSDLELAVVLPPTAIAGSRLNIQLDDGRVFEIIVPSGTSPGQTINVVVPNSADGGIVCESVDEPTSSEPKEYSSNSKTMGAAAAAAVVGTLVIGPVVGIVAAGAAVYATTREDNIGEASRAVGGAACAAYDKAAEVSKKYGLFDKVKSAASATAGKMKEINDEYKITDKAKAAGSQAIQKAREVDAKYEITSSASKAVTQGIIMGAKEVTKASATKPSTAK